MAPVEQADGQQQQQELQQQYDALLLVEPPASSRDMLEQQWDAFRERLLEEPGYAGLANGPGWDTSRLERACRVSWELCAGETEALRAKMLEMNLHNLRQQQVLREKLPRTIPYADVDLTEKHLVHYYESLSYVDSNVRELIIQILCDKVDELLEGGATSLLKELAAAGAGSGGHMKAHLEQAQERAQRAEAQQALLKRQLTQVTEERDELDTALKAREKEVQAGLAREHKLQEQINSLAEELAIARGQVTVLKRQLAKLQEEVAAFAEVKARLEAELQSTKDELERVAVALERTQRELQKAQARVRETEEQMATMKHEMRKLEEQNRELESRCDRLTLRAEAGEARAEQAEEEVRQLREKLRALMNRVTSGTQTDLRGSEVESQAQECSRVKADFEDARAKLQAFVKELTRRYGAKEIANLLEGMGLDCFASGLSCFDRLYEDALDRHVRLENLQDDYAERRACELHDGRWRRANLHVELPTMLGSDAASARTAAQLKFDRRLQQPPVFSPLPNGGGEKAALPPLQLPSAARAPSLPLGSSGYQRPSGVRRATGASADSAEAGKRALPPADAAVASAREPTRRHASFLPLDESLQPSQPQQPALLAGLLHQSPLPQLSARVQQQLASGLAI